MHIYISGVRSGHASHTLLDQRTLRDDLIRDEDFFLENTMIFGGKARNLRLICSKDLFAVFIFREQDNFETKSKKYLSLILSDDLFFENTMILG